MRIKIEMTVEVDEDVWAREYGLAKGEVREDVRVWAQSAVENAPIPMRVVR